MKVGRSLLQFLAFAVFLFGITAVVFAQTGNSGTITGAVTDPTGAAIPGASVTIHNPVSGYQASTTTDATGTFDFANVPFNPYHMTVTAKGFSATAQDVEVRSVLPVNVKVPLQLAGATTTVTVESGGDLVENTPVTHTDVSRQLFEKLPLESASSSLSSLVTLASPGIVADSNGLFHGMGDHAENSFSMDGQPITDQQSKVFSNQIPTDAVQSLEVIEGAPPAEYGDKTSVIIDVTTRSGQGETTPHGSASVDYGTFGTTTGGFDSGYGGQKWGNFLAVHGLNTGRFLDPPEFDVMHDRGNEESVFDRADYQFSSADSAHLDLEFTRSWFQTPNSFDSQLATGWKGVAVDNAGLGPDGVPVGPTDQRSQIRTFNVGPTWTHLINPNTVFTGGVWVRHDQYNYYPSGDPFADFIPDLQSQSASQLRFLTNAGARASVSYVKGINNVKAGIDYEQTFLTEHDGYGIVDPNYNAPCLDASGNPVFVGNPGVNDPSLCGASASTNNILYPTPFVANPDFSPLLGCYDLTRAAPLPASDGCPAGQATSAPYRFFGHTDVKELALYVQDSISKGNWNFNLGVRGDLYNGLTVAHQAEPRIGVAYHIKPSSTILRVSYARTLETPFNENLVISSLGCSNPVLGPLNGVSGTGFLLCNANSFTPLSPGYRNEFHAGLGQAFGKHVVFDGEYVWKYTHNAYDFSVVGNTPITYPIEWHNSKVTGFAGRVNVTNFGGFTAYVDMATVAARFFTPQTGGAGAAPSGISVFRIDHDESYEQTAHLQYQPWARGPWLGFNWRFDSGLVAGPVPCAGGEDCANGPLGTDSVVDVSGLTADQQAEAGFFCGTVHAAPPTPSNPLGTPISSPLGANLCPGSEYGSNLVRIPAPGTENDDKNPPRIAWKNLFDLAIGDDNLFHADRYRWSARLTVVNLANDYAAYNFLSTFSGTHYVTPRTVTAQIGFHF
ncbi:MAG: carboxypeptidase regulatory-like domain-containing protein [Candidatus Acidiferrales bacterium]